MPLKNCSNYPPLESTERDDNPPPGNRPEKSLQLPPLEFTERYDNPTPLLEIGLRNHSNYPPLEFTANVEFVQLEKILRITPGTTSARNSFSQLPAAACNRHTPDSSPSLTLCISSMLSCTRLKPKHPTACSWCTCSTLHTCNSMHQLAITS